MAVDPSIEFRDGNERIFGEFFRVFFFREMEVDAPRAGDATVGENFFAHDVVAREHDVTDDAAGFTRAADVGDPVELGVGMLGSAVAIFHRVKRAKNCAEVPIADEFEVVERMLGETAFPKPFAFTFVLHLAFAGLGVRKIIHLKIERPRRRREGARGGGVAPNPHVGHAEKVFEFDLGLGAGESRERPVARTIGEKFAAEFFPPTVTGIERRR